MPKIRLVFPSLVVLISQSFAQAPSARKSTSGGNGGPTALKLAQSGHCAEALPLLKKSVLQIADRDKRKQSGLAAVHCAMNLNRPDDTAYFLNVLGRDFPDDPEVLYVSTHAYSDLSLRASQRLMQVAPTSYQVHELNAEALETQGKWDEAIGEYRKILDQNPRLAGIHYRIGRVILSAPATDSTAETAKKEFEQELEIDPTNAGAEYVLGELAREAQDWLTAISHFTRATELDHSFSDAYFGLGRSLISADKFADAIPPLEAFVKLQPQEPAGHFQLGTAYNRAGRKADAEKEFALYRQTTTDARKTREELSKKLQGQKTPE